MKNDYKPKSNGAPVETPEIEDCACHAQEPTPLADKFVANFTRLWDGAITSGSMPSNSIDRANFRLSLVKMAGDLTLYESERARQPVTEAPANG